MNMILAKRENNSSEFFYWILKVLKLCIFPWQSLILKYLKFKSRMSGWSIYRKSNQQRGN